MSEVKLKMLWIALLIVSIGLILFIVATILDFSSASKSRKGDTKSAANLANAAAWLNIIGLILIIAGIIAGTLMFHAGGGTTALSAIATNPQNVGKLISQNSEHLKDASL